MKLKALKYRFIIFEFIVLALNFHVIVDYFCFIAIICSLMLDFPMKLLFIIIGS